MYQEEVNKTLANVGRPLHVQIHDSSHSSVLSSDSDKIQFRGLVNLLVLLLFSYTFRAIFISLEKYNFVLYNEVKLFLTLLLTSLYRLKSSCQAA